METYSGTWRRDVFVRIGSGRSETLETEEWTFYPIPRSDQVEDPDDTPSAPKRLLLG